MNELIKNEYIQYLNYVKHVLTLQLEDYSNGLTIDKKSLSDLFTKTSNILRGGR